MKSLEGLAHGFAVAATPANLFFCFIGVVVGTAVGVLPGLGPATAIALLLPLTFKLPPVAAIIMLAGIYYGAMYGGSTTSILMNLPGEAASVVTCLDGHAMARKGRGGPALVIAAVGSFVAGTIAVVLLTFLAPVLVSVALSLGPPESCALLVLGLACIAFFASGSKRKAAIVTVLGLLCGTVGVDSLTATYRFTFGTRTLSDGIGIVPVAMGLFGVAEVLTTLAGGEDTDADKAQLQGLWPSREEWRRSSLPVARATIIGFILGILPGAGAIMAPFVSYAVEKRVSKSPEKFGSGMIEGVAGPEAANNAAAGAAFVPLLSLGLPANPAAAILLGALLIHGLQPGPLLATQAPDVFWGVISSMYIGNVLLLILNVPFVGVWVRLARMRYSLLHPIILVVCLSGAFATANEIGDPLVVCAFGLIGFAFKRHGYEAAPFIFALVVGPLLEDSFRQSLILSSGDLSVFVVRPFSAVLIVLAVATLVLAVVRRRPQPRGLGVDK